MREKKVDVTSLTGNERSRSISPNLDAESTMTGESIFWTCFRVRVRFWIRDTNSLSLSYYITAKSFSFLSFSPTIGLYISQLLPYTRAALESAIGKRREKALSDFSRNVACSLSLSTFPRLLLARFCLRPRLHKPLYTWLRLFLTRRHWCTFSRSTCLSREEEKHAYDARVCVSAHAYTRPSRTRTTGRLMVGAGCGGQLKCAIMCGSRDHVTASERRRPRELARIFSRLISLSFSFSLALSRKRDLEIRQREQVRLFLNNAFCSSPVFIKVPMNYIPFLS